MKQSAAGRSRCPHCGASVDSNEQNCWICGAELNANAPATGRKPSAATHAPAEPPQPPAPQPKPEPERPSASAPQAAPSAKAEASKTTASPSAAGAAPKIQTRPAPAQAVSRGPAKPAPPKRTGVAKPRAYPKMSVPRNMSGRRDQRGWLLAVPLLAVLISFVYFGDPFHLRASPAAEASNITATSPVMTVVMLQPAPTQPTPLASNTPIPATTDTVTPPPTATSTQATPTALAPTETPAAATAAATKTVAATRPKATSTATSRPTTVTVSTATQRPPSVTPTATLVPGPGPNGTWVVARGDSCARIASQAGVSVEALVQANALQNNCFLRAGQVLIIPTPGPATATAPATPTVRASTTAAPTPTRATATPLPTIGPPATQTAAATTAAVNGQRSYTVKAGDTCYRIGRAENVAVEDLIRVNNLDARCFLSVGQTLVLP